MFLSFANDYERSFAFVRERLRMIMNDYEWLWMSMSVHERSWTFRRRKVHESSRTFILTFINLRVGNFWMTRTVTSRNIVIYFNKIKVDSILIESTQIIRNSNFSIEIFLVFHGVILKDKTNSVLIQVFDSWEWNWNFCILL